MNTCWILLLTRGLRVWLPPEVYLQRQLADREAERWRETFRLPGEAPDLSERSRHLLLVRSLFPEPWRACPVWVGVSWSARSYPAMKIDLMAADEQEAAGWLRRRTPKDARIDGAGQVEFVRSGVRTGVGVFRVKRVMGF